MAVTPSAGLLSAANAAAAGVADGQKNAAWCAAIASGIGSGYKLVARRDSVVSQHVVAEEAYERAARAGAGVYRWVPAPIEIQVP